MRYIRTKDGRIIDTTKIATGSKYMDFATNDESFREIFKTDPLAKSDTIKELCDGFYLDIDNHPFDSTQVYDKYELQKALKEKMDWQSYSDRKYLEYEINLYAFIKTSKGLIFVAKMNDEDKSCLI